MIPKTLPLALLFLLSSAVFYPILAQTDPEDSVPSPQPQVLSESETNTVENVRKAVQEKVKEKLNQITSPETNVKKAWIGTVKKVDPTQITIDTHNTSKTVNFDTDTTVVGLKRQKVDPATLTEGTTILCMGFTESTDTLTAKRIVVTDPKTIIRRQIVTGTIVDVSQSSPIFVLIPNTNKNLQYQIKTDSKTAIQNSTGQKKKSAELTKGRKVVVVLTPDAKANNTYLASMVILRDEAPTPTPTPKDESPTATPSVKNAPRQ